jgi:hypothetical protein
MDRALRLRCGLNMSTGHFSDPVVVEAAQNGSFIVVCSYSTTLADYTCVIARCDATGGASIYTGTCDAVGASFSKPRGVGITPRLSISSPRPGVQAAGIQRFHGVVRDPSITEIVYEVDGSVKCTDDELWDGSSEDCEIDTSGWSTGDHVVTVVANGGTNGDFSMNATYSTYL